MPKFGLSPEEIHAISYFLKSRVKEPYYETPMIRMAKQREQERLEKKGPPKWVSVRGGAAQGKEMPGLSHVRRIRRSDRTGPLLYGFHAAKGLYQEFPAATGKRNPWRHHAEGPHECRERKTEITSSPSAETKDVHLHRGNSQKCYMMLCQRCHAAQGDGFGIIEPNLATFPRGRSARTQTVLQVHPGSRELRGEPRQGSFQEPPCPPMASCSGGTRSIPW